MNRKLKQIHFQFCFSIDSIREVVCKCLFYSDPQLNGTSVMSWCVLYFLFGREIESCFSTIKYAALSVPRKREGEKGKVSLALK